VKKRTTPEGTKLFKILFKFLPV